MKHYYKKIVQSNVSLLILILFCQNVSAIPGWQWAKNAGGTSEERSRNTAIDNNGNVYSIGSFAGSDINFGLTTLTNSGLEDIYLVKYDQSGNVLWAQSFGSADNEVGYGVCCDQNGNVYITGYFDGATITFGTITLNNAGSEDIFLVKIAPDGTILWANSYGGNGQDYGNNLSVDLNENVYLVGNFNSPSIIFGSTSLLAVGTAKAFVVKFDPSGNALWAGGSRGPSYDAGKCVTTDNNGNIYMAGEFYDNTIWFDSDSITNGGLDDIFVVKYDLNGNEVWVKTFGGFNPDKITGIYADNNGEVYISGHFYSPFIQFDGITLTNADFPAWDMFIAKLDVNSNVLWAKSAVGNTDEDEIVDMERIPNGNFIVSGWFIGSITLGNTTLISNGMSDVFVAEFDPSGTFQWAVSTGGTDQDYSNSVSIDQNGDAVIGGFSQSASLPFGGTILTDITPGWDMFVAKLSNQTSVNEISTGQIDIYPNPANENFTLVFPDQISYSFELRNSLGQIVMQNQFNGSNQKVSCNGLSEGIYFLQIESKGETVSKKLVIGR